MWQKIIFSYMHAINLGAVVILLFVIRFTKLLIQKHETRKNELKFSESHYSEGKNRGNTRFFIKRIGLR